MSHVTPFPRVSSSLFRGSHYSPPIGDEVRPSVHFCLAGGGYADGRRSKEIACRGQVLGLALLRRHHQTLVSSRGLRLKPSTFSLFYGPQPKKKKNHYQFLTTSYLAYQSADASLRMSGFKSEPCVSRQPAPDLCSPSPWDPSGLLSNRPGLLQATPCGRARRKSSPSAKHYRYLSLSFLFWGRYYETRTPA